MDEALADLLVQTNDRGPIELSQNHLSSCLDI